jgi:hypothetical protein
MKLDLNPVAQAARLLLVRLEQTGSALHHQRNTVLPPLQQAVDAAAEALAAADTAQALALAAGDEAALALAEQQAVQLAADLDARRAELDRQRRVESALASHLQAAEAELAALVPGLRDAVVQHQHAHMQGWNERLQRANAAYINVLDQIAAEASAGGNTSVSRSLGEMVLSDLAAPAALWVAYGRVKHQDGSTVALGSGPLDATLAADLSAPRRLLAEVQSYTPYAQREAQTLAQRGTHQGRNSLVVAPPTEVDDTPARTATAAAMPAARRGRSAGSAVRLA